ncbi:MAG: hypothetical protein HUU20_21070 [Pirellulales bacterium]|nr:hypothetical protein [Pirellulales bacterium]
MPSKARPEPQWESVVSEPRAGSPWLQRFESVIMLLAVIMPLMLAAALGVCAGRGYWQRWPGAPQPQSPNAGDEAIRLGRRAETLPDVKYDGGGRAHLGEYSVKVYDPVNRTTLRADFVLEGEIACADRAGFDSWMAGHGRALREQVMVAVRNSDTAELTDPKLTVLGGKLLARVNRSFNEPFLKSVKFKSFLLYESVRNSDYVLWEEANDTRR